MRLIDADKLIEVFEEYDHYLWGLPDKENPHKRAKQGQLNWCINKTKEIQTIDSDDHCTEKISNGIACCSIGECPGRVCPYWHSAFEDGIKECDCTTELIRDIRNLLKAKRIYKV